MNEIKEIKQIIENGKRIAIFTGAGISVPSGIPDFRSADGLYNQKSGLNIKPEEIISHSFFLKNTDDFFKFYKTKMVYQNALPNMAHKYFASLETPGRMVTVITQNIDGLHSDAGSSIVLELHGSIRRNHCMNCRKNYTLEDIMKDDKTPYCSCGGIIKPDVTLYEEDLDYSVLYSAINSIIEADVLIIVGTSLVVNPAASLIRYFKGDNLIIINKEKTPKDYLAKYVINDDIINVVNKLI